MAEKDERPFSPSIAASTPGSIEDADNGSQSSDQGEAKAKSHKKAAAKAEAKGHH